MIVIFKRLRRNIKVVKNILEELLNNFVFFFIFLFGVVGYGKIRRVVKFNLYFGDLVIFEVVGKGLYFFRYIE